MIPIIDTLQPLGDFFAVLAEDVGVNGVSLEAVLHASELELAKKASKEYVDEKIATIPKVTKTSQLQNDSGFLTQHQDLSAYAKKSEVPTKTSQLQNDSGFLTQHQSLAEYVKTTDSRLTNARPASDVSAWAKATNKPSYSKAEIGLGNVNNTSDADKPISTATQIALNSKASAASVTDISGRLDTAETNISVNTARINEIIALPEGSTTSDAELADLRVSASGTTYDTAGNAVRAQINGCKRDIGYANDASRSYNYDDIRITNAICDYNYAGRPKTSGYYSNDGRINANENAFVIQPVNFLKGDNISLKNVYGYFCFYKYEGGTMQKISSSTASATSFNLGATEKGTLFISIHKDHVSDASVYIQHRMPVNNVGLHKTNFVTVGKGTGYNYNSVFEAVEAVKSLLSPDENNRCEIRVFKGTYDVWEEIGGASFTKQIILPDYTDIVGMENDVVIQLSIPDSEVTYRASELLSTINMNKNNNLKNITLRAYNCRYPIHDETNTDVSYCTQHFDNVKFYHDGYKAGSTESEVWHWTSGFGGGSNVGMEYYFNNCQFYGYGNPAFGMHDNVNNGKGIYIEMNDCSFFTTGEYSFRLTTAYNNIGNHTCVLNNCYIGQRVNLGVEGGASANNWNVRGGGNTKVAVNEINSNTLKWLMSDECMQIKFPDGISKGDTVYVQGLSAYKMISGKKVAGVALGDVAEGNRGWIMFNGNITDGALGIDVASGDEISIGANGRAVKGTSGTLGEFGYSVHSHYVKLYNKLGF